MCRRPSVVQFSSQSQLIGLWKPKATAALNHLEIPTSHGKQLVRCHESLKFYVESDAVCRTKFNFSVPVFLSKKHSDEGMWARMQQYPIPYGWKELPKGDITSTLSLLDDVESTWLFSPGSNKGCISCAVVGNGGILNGSRQGKEIDAHDFVIRLNGAIIDGFEDDVGTKISFYGFTTNTMKNSLLAYRKWGYKNVPQNKELVYIFIPSEFRDYLMLRSAILGVRVPEGKDKNDEPWKYFGLKTPAKKFKMMHPSFLRYIKDSFLNSSALQSKYSHLYMPSTGALMLMIALHQCDQVSAYGFITDNYKDFSDHYYEGVKQPLIFYANHDLKMEAQLWKALDKAKIIKLYQR